MKKLTVICDRISGFMVLIVCQVMFSGFGCTGIFNWFMKSAHRIPLSDQDKYFLALGFVGLISFFTIYCRGKEKEYESSKR